MSVRRRPPPSPHIICWTRSADDIIMVCSVLARRYCTNLFMTLPLCTRVHKAAANRKYNIMLLYHFEPENIYILFMFTTSQRNATWTLNNFAQAPLIIIIQYIRFANVKSHLLTRNDAIAHSKLVSLQPFQPNCSLHIFLSASFILIEPRNSFYYFFTFVARVNTELNI